MLGILMSNQRVMFMGSVAWTLAKGPFRSLFAACQEGSNCSRVSLMHIVERASRQISSLEKIFSSVESLILPHQLALIIIRWGRFRGDHFFIAPKVIRAAEEQLMPEPKVTVTSEACTIKHQGFLQQVKRMTAHEKQTYQAHFIDLCHFVGPEG